jgi:hypothetical protein
MVEDSIVTLTVTVERNIPQDLEGDATQFGYERNISQDLEGDAFQLDRKRCCL